MSNVVTESRTEAPATAAHDREPVASGALQMKSALRGAGLEVQRSLLAPTAPTGPDRAAGIAAATPTTRPEPVVTQLRQARAIQRLAVQQTPDAAQPAAEPAAAQPAAPEPAVTLQSGVEASASILAALKKILKAANLASATVTSGVRSSDKQAEAMYNNARATGVAAQLALYGNPGDKVIRVYEAEEAAGKSPAQIKAAMKDKIVEIGPSLVSKHCSDTHDTIDVSSGSIAQPAAFKTALAKAVEDGDISKFIPPGGGEPAYHIEKPK